LITENLSKTGIGQIYRAFFHNFIAEITAELADCKSILDMGCGSGSPISPFPAANYSVGIDLFLTSLKKAKKTCCYSDLVQGDIFTVAFKPKSFDAVISTDVLEHFTKKSGLELIKKMEGIAIKKVIILTPNGFSLKEHFEDENEFQEHKSGWTTKEFEDLGFAVRGALGLRYLRGERAQFKAKPADLLQIIADTSQLITFSHSQYAYHLLCAKNCTFK
jgi:SAM-dependent methyltransferase